MLFRWLLFVSGRSGGFAVDGIVAVAIHVAVVATVRVVAVAAALVGGDDGGAPHVTYLWTPRIGKSICLPVMQAGI